MNRDVFFIYVGILIGLSYMWARRADDRLDELEYSNRIRGMGLEPAKGEGELGRLPGPEDQTTVD